MRTEKFRLGSSDLAFFCLALRSLRTLTFWVSILLMDKILHDPKDPKLWELWYIPFNG